MEKTIDCVVCGSCTVDIVVRPFPLDKPFGASRLLPAEAIEATTGGLVSNAGIAMARLGLRVAALSYVGDDPWADLVRSRYEANGIVIDALQTHPSQPTSTTIVLVDTGGERSFVHAQGAPKGIDRRTLLDQLDLFRRSRMMLIGYYSLMPNLESDLPDVLAAIRAAGCRTALDAAGSGGTMRPLDKILPHLDVYVPSFVEAHAQTGQDDPRRMIGAYRECGATGL